MPVEIDWREIQDAAPVDEISRKQLPILLGYVYGLNDAEKSRAINQARNEGVLQEAGGDTYRIRGEDAVVEIEASGEVVSSDSTNPDLANEKPSNSDFPELPPDEYGSSAEEMYADAARFLGRYSKGSATLDARIRGVRTKEEASILASAEADHQARKPVVAALNQRRMELEGSA